MFTQKYQAFVLGLAGKKHGLDKRRKHRKVLKFADYTHISSLMIKTYDGIAIYPVAPDLLTNLPDGPVIYLTHLFDGQP